MADSGTHAENTQDQCGILCDVRKKSNVKNVCVCVCGGDMSKGHKKPTEKTHWPKLK